MHTQEPAPGGPDPEYKEVADAMMEWGLVWRTTNRTCAVL